MIAEVATALGTAMLVAPAAGYAGAKFREKLPIRIPTNATRIDDAETDLKLMEIARERRQVDFNIERDRLVGEKELHVARASLEEHERREIAAREGDDHKVLEARLLDCVRRAFPDEPWGTVRNADDVLCRLEDAAVALRLRDSDTRDHMGRIREELRRAWINGRMPKYLSDAAQEAGLL